MFEVLGHKDVMPSQNNEKESCWPRHASTLGVGERVNGLIVSIWLRSSLVRMKTPSTTKRAKSEQEGHYYVSNQSLQNLGACFRRARAMISQCLSTATRFDNTSYFEQYSFGGVGE